MFRLGLQIFQGLKPQALAKSIKHAQNYTCICSYPNLTKNFAPERNFQTTCDLYNAQEKEKLIVKIATIGETPRILKLLHRSFFKDEPVLKALIEGDVSSELEDYYLKDICEGSSLLAVGDCDQIAGIAINYTTVLPDFQKLLRLAKCTKNQDMAKLYTFHAYIETKSNLWCQLKLDKMFQIRTLATDHKFREQGVSKLLIEKSIEEAQKRRFPLIRLDCTSEYCAKAAESLCMQLVYTLKYENYVNACKRPIFKVEGPHEGVKTYVLAIGT